MSRYIDADRLIKQMERRYEEMRLKYGEYDQFNMGYAEGMVAIDNAPTVDVVAVTRCKDCKHCNEYTNWSNREYLGCSWNGEIYEVEAEHYCSYGEKRTEDD